ncbi:MAG: ribonuclease Z [Flavobacteriales bacterium]|nr:ribonuclease Z [Flavobacteriales bacterium]
MHFRITILGCSSAIPTKDRFPTSQIVDYSDQFFLLDCAEGTQMQLRRYHFSFQRIGHIFISHMHSDHFLGLPGLLSTMDLLGRKTPLHLYAPSEVIVFIRQYKQMTHTPSHYELIYHEIANVETGILWENDHLTISCFPVKHSVPCHAFVFAEKPRPRRMKKNAIIEYGLTVEQIHSAKEGQDITLSNGKIIANDVLSISPPRPRKYVYMTDTAFMPDASMWIKNADVLYHEATFGNDLKERAVQTCHSTAWEAGKIAEMANVKRLVIGHFSVRYQTTELLENEARQTFKNTEAAYDGKLIDIPYDLRTI